MASINKAIIVGHLGKDPETRYMPDGDAVTNITVATSQTWKDKNGNKMEDTEWHRVTFYRKLAEIAGEYLAKGGLVYIEGRLKTRKWTDKQGVDHYTTEIIASDMKMLGKKPRDESGDDDDDNDRARTRQEEKTHDEKGRSFQSKSTPPTGKTGTGFDSMDDDIPF